MQKNNKTYEKNYFLVNGKARNKFRVYSTTTLFLFMIYLIKDIDIIQIVIKSSETVGLDLMNCIKYSDYWKLAIFFILPQIIGYIFICMLIKITFYVIKRDNYQKWKCQPTRWLSLKDEFLELKMSVLNLVIGGILTSILFILHQKFTIFKIYRNHEKYGDTWYLISTFLYFIYIDLFAFIVHRMLHIPFLYKTIHKHHHYFINITPFSALALHPIEYLMMVTVSFLFLFAVPIHIMAVTINLSYIFIFNILNHSGVKFYSYLLWEPNSIYHDDHHRYFHTNYGQSLVIWDKICKTLRRTNKVYGEDIFY